MNRVMNRIYMALLFAACLAFSSCGFDGGQQGTAIREDGKTAAVKNETARAGGPQDPNGLEKPPEAAKATADGKAAETGREALPQRESPHDPNEPEATSGELKKEPPQALRAALAEYKKAKSEAANAEESMTREITGLIIEETMTRIGYDFYECFFMSWEAPQGIMDYNILITERANPMWGSWVQVEVNGNPAWSMVVKPRHEEVEDAAKDAVEAAKGYLRNYDVFRKQLQSEDMSGDGI